MARNVIDVEGVIAAGQTVVATSGDVEIARTDSNNNQKDVAAAAEEIVASKARVDAFIQRLLDQVQKAEAEVAGTDWDSQSRRNFEAEINRFTAEVRTLGANYTASYEESLAAIKRIQTAVVELDGRFSKVCTLFIPVLEANGNKAISHATQSGDFADRDITFG